MKAADKDKSKLSKAIPYGVAFLLLLLIVLGALFGKKLWNGYFDEVKLKKDMKITNFHNDLFGENIYIFRPEDKAEEVNAILEELWSKQETNQFGEERYGVLFMPGAYDPAIEVKVGYYMEVAGLGTLPTDTVIPSLNCTATWLGDDSNHNATCNFWRGVGNLSIDSNTMWAVSQATFMRRVDIKGNLAFHDNYGWSSGGFLANSRISGVVDSGSQQQWLSRNSDWNLWLGQNWNMVFVGMADKDAPKGTWPGTKYTSVEETPVIAEKPFLYYDEKEGYQVYVPDVIENTKSYSWEDDGHSLSLEEFYVAKAEVDTAATLNGQLKEGKHLLLTPGIYHLEEPIRVTNPNTIVLGIGLATLIPDNGTACMEVSDVGGVRLAGVLFDAGPMESEVLVQIGGLDETMQQKDGINPIVLSDLFFRVGGVAGYEAKVKKCVVIASDHLIGDNFWVWRADHGDEVAWDKNTAPNGIIVNGDDVTIYALMVEHFQEYQTIWNGENGRVYFYQSEIPYDVPNQEVWRSHSGAVNGFSSYKVGDEVKSHEAWGLGIYSYHRDARVDLFSAMEVPDVEGVKIHNICAIMITGNPGISHVINDQGEACRVAGDRKIIVEYEAGIQK
jgi:hypothetical protein